LFWKKEGTQWLCRTMFDEVPLPLDWPVYVSHAEASAYSRWAGKSLPTEASGSVPPTARLTETQESTRGATAAPNAKLGNFDFHHWDPAPVNSFPEGQSAFGVHDLLGNGWEWTSTVFGPFPISSHFRFTAGTRLIFSMASISS
jgi:gamma-glutamyl hercynylcysteine S-oxide synthase